MHSAGGLPDGIELRYLAGDDPLMREVLDLCYETLHRPFNVSRSDDWGNLEPGSYHLVALTDGRVVGYARLLTEVGGGHVRQVAVAETHRRRGIATALLRELIARADSLGMELLYLNARLLAVTLYEGVGFVVTSGVFKMPRTWVDHVRMELRRR